MMRQMTMLIRGSLLESVNAPTGLPCLRAIHALSRAAWACSMHLLSLITTWRWSQEASCSLRASMSQGWLPCALH